jgi:hypothetical protein
MTEICFGPPGSEKIKTQISLTFCAFTQSYGSDDMWLLLINDSDSLRAFGTLQCLTPTILWSVELRSEGSASTRPQLLMAQIISGVRALTLREFHTLLTLKLPKLISPNNLDDLLPLTTICDNIWLHRGWHAPCELPRTSSSIAFCIGLWSHAKKTSY